MISPPICSDRGPDFFTGWTYWFCWVVTGIADVVAISAYAQFWLPDLSQWISSLLCVLLLLTLNLATVKLFGEMEFWFAMIKIVAIVALIVIGAGLVIMHFTSPSGAIASVSNLWQDEGFFPKGLSGFFAGFQIAVFAFVGIELVGTTAAETKNPNVVLPRAINAIPIRIIMFYVFALIMIMSVTPWSHIAADRSPFVEMFVLVGLPAAASVINFVVLTSAASSANSGVFSTSRMLFGLARQGDAPARFGQLSKRAVPSAGLLFSCLCLLSGVVLIYLIPNVMTVFYAGDDRLRYSVHVRMEHYPVLLSGVPSASPTATPRLFIQNAMRYSNELGLSGFLCFRTGIADAAAGYTAGIDGDTHMVCGAGNRLSAYSPT
ncbi:hypothetical protein OS12_35860 [Dickeya oryzae]